MCITYSYCIFEGMLAAFHPDEQVSSL